MAAAGEGLGAWAPRPAVAAVRGGGREGALGHVRGRPGSGSGAPGAPWLPPWSASSCNGADPSPRCTRHSSSSLLLLCCGARGRGVAPGPPQPRAGRMAWHVPGLNPGHVRLPSSAVASSAGRPRARCPLRQVLCASTVKSPLPSNIGQWAGYMRARAVLGPRVAAGRARARAMQAARTCPPRTHGGRGRRHQHQPHSQSRLQHAVSSLQPPSPGRLQQLAGRLQRLAGRLHAPSGAGAGRCCSLCVPTSLALKWRPGVLQRLRQRRCGEGSFWWLGVRSASARLRRCRYAEGGQGPQGWPGGGRSYAARPS